MRITMIDRRTLAKLKCDRYRKAGKKEKSRLLDEFVKEGKCSRAHARWLLRNHGRRVEVKPGVFVEGDARLRPPRQRKKTYGAEFLGPLKRVWEMLDFLCAKRLVAALPEVLPRLAACGELRLRKAVVRRLLAMSASTMDRLLRPERAKHRLTKRRAGTKPGTLLKHHVPVRTFADWDQAQPGFLEMDLVGHDGGVAAGDYCQTLDMTDVATGWSEQVAVLNRAQQWVFEGIQTVRARLPFPLRGLDSDNGGEFINHHLVRYCRAERLTFTRSRGYQKNDTCYVEQKNWSVVRRFVGYARYESAPACEALNELYGALRDYTNFFLPSQKLREKIRDGAHVTRRYDRPQTPYARLLNSDAIDARVKRRLRAYYETLNPAALHRRIRALQKQLDALRASRPTARPHPQNEFTALVPIRRRKSNGGKHARPRPSSRPLGRRSGRTPASPYPPPRPPQSYPGGPPRSRTKNRSPVE